MIFLGVYILSIIVLVLFFSGWLLRRNLAWMVVVANVSLIIIILLDYMQVIPHL